MTNRSRVVAPLSLVLLSLLLLMPTPAAADVPEGAVVYFRWAGVGADTPGYEGSHLQAVLKDTDIVGRVGRTIDAMIQAEGNDPEAVEVRKALDELAPGAWERPWAVVFEGVDWGDDAEAREPRAVKLSFLIAPGDRAEAVRKWLNRAIETYDGDEESRPELFDEEGVLGLMIGGKTEGVTRIAAALRDPAGGVKLMPEHTVEAPIYALYIDVAQAVSIIDDGVRRSNPGGNDYQEWQTFRTASGLDGLKQVVISGGFDGKDWRESAFVAAPAPRKGLLKLIDGEAITANDLAAIPASASWVRAMHLDPAATFDAIRDLVGKVDERGAEDFDEMLAEMKQEVGIDLRADLLEPLGTKWMLYSDPSFGTEFGGNLPGVALVSPLDDAAKVQRSMVKIEAEVDQELQREEAPFRFNTLDTGEVEVHSFTTPVVSPAWLVADGRLVVALSPNAAMTAAAMAKADGSVADSAAYKAVASKLPLAEGDGKLMGLMVVDLKKTAVPIYTGLRALATMAQSQIRDEEEEEGGVDVTQLLPPLNTILPHLGPAGQTIRVDDAGVHIEMIQPFPGSTLMSPDAAFGGNTAIAPLTIGMTLPALSAARRSAQQMQAVSQTRQITVMLHTRAADFRGNLTSDPGALRLYYGDDATDIFLAPHAGTVAANEAYRKVGEDDAKFGRWVREYGSYVLVSEGSLSDMPRPAQTVLVFQKPLHAQGDEIAIGYADGHASRMLIDEADATLKKQTGKTLEQLVKEFEAGGAADDTSADAAADDDGA